MIEFFSDVITAVRLTREIRRAKNLPVCAYPRVSGASWLDTIESGVFRSSIELEKALRNVFRGFDAETQRALAFVPGDGEWIERARFWKERLKVLPPKDYHAAMRMILQWYILRVKNRKNEKREAL